MGNKTEKFDVVISGSIAFQDKWQNLQDYFGQNNLTTHLPEPDTVDWLALNELEFRDKKYAAMQQHFAKIALARVLLVTNYDKKGIAGYIGANTLMESGVASFLGKPIYLLNDIPVQDSRDEIIGLKPIVLHNNLEKLVDDLKGQGQ